MSQAYRSAAAIAQIDVIADAAREFAFSESDFQSLSKLAYEQTGIVLEINQRAYLPVNLEVGQATERIEVSAEAPLITTEESSIGRVIDNKSITRIPLNGRLSITGLMLLALFSAPGSTWCPDFLSRDGRR